ncbi:hypothetical protein LCGC14_0195360 [marine sediment metagenome]|uniref:Uncharacterized protein n=1 Tax=marine sediment metagenome TaxID=412755 RepID=A0A0F9XNC3_9ZZZZ
MGLANGPGTLVIIVEGLLQNLIENFTDTVVKERRIKKNEKNENRD